MDLNFQYDEVGRRRFPRYFNGYSHKDRTETLGDYFFNTSNIKWALMTLIALNKEGDFHRLLLRDDDLKKDLNRREGDIIEVYFSDIHEYRIVSKHKNKKWFEALHDDFLFRVRDIPTGVKEQYFYGPSGKERSSQEYKPEDKSLYQGFLYLFDGALKVFSCFVGDQAEISFNSYNYEGEPSYEKWGHTDDVAWKGELEDFLGSTKEIERAIKNMVECGYRISNPTHGGNSISIRLVHPELGMICMKHLKERDEHTYYLNKNRLEEIVKTVKDFKMVFA